MKTFNIVFAISIVLTTSIFVSSCTIHFPTEDIEKINYIELRNDCENRPTISYDITFKSAATGDKELNRFDFEGERELFEKTLIESSAFKSVKENNPKADIHVNMLFTIFGGNYGNHEMVTAISAALIPVEWEYGLNISGKAESKSKSISFYYHDKISTVTWLLLLPIAIFKSDYYAREDISEYRYMMITNKIINDIVLACNED